MWTDERPAALPSRPPLQLGAVSALHFALLAAATLRARGVAAAGALLGAAAAESEAYPHPLEALTAWLLVAALIVGVRGSP